MKLLGNEENSDSGNRPQIRTSQDDAAVGYGFHPSQENEFPAAFVPKRWTGTEEIIEVSASYFIYVIASVSLWSIHFIVFAKTIEPGKMEVSSDISATIWKPESTKCNKTTTLIESSSISNAQSSSIQPFESINDA